jgi:hypothetical protein
MGKPSEFKPARLVLGILSAPGEQTIGEAPGGALARALEGRFGPIDRLGPELDFRFSPYYDEEMGGRPRRSFASFPRLVDPSRLAAIKTWTDELELSLSDEGRRRFNLDPGILSLSSFCLATTKDRPHRIALADGIYAELTLIYDKGDYRGLPWTYPDWASEEYRAYLRGVRALLKEELRDIDMRSS